MVGDRDPSVLPLEQSLSVVEYSYGRLHAYQATYRFMHTSLSLPLAQSDHEYYHTYLPSLRAGIHDNAFLSYCHFGIGLVRRLGRYIWCMVRGGGWILFGVHFGAENCILMEKNSD